MKARLNWTRAEIRSGRSRFPAYQHTSGWRVQHCCHPTANYPYQVTDPDGRLVVDTHGRAFSTVARALDVVDAILFGWYTTHNGQLV